MTIETAKVISERMLGLTSECDKVIDQVFPQLSPDEREQFRLCMGMIYQGIYDSLRLTYHEHPELCPPEIQGALL
jgi:hypothetical protein